jgi:hypothetical protein
MRSTGREYFTVDLRGLRAALAACAADEGVTESDLLRSALAARLGADTNALSPSRSDLGDKTGQRSCLKLSVRVPGRAAERLDLNSRAAGLSRGAYLTGLIEGAPRVVASADRSELAAALKRSAEELALLSRDIHHLTALLSRGSVAAAKEYRARLESVDKVVWAHLDLAARVLAELTPARRGTFITRQHS